MPFIALALVIAAVLGGGTAALAQTSLPGDALWGFKVNVDEGVAGALSATNTAKADWDLTSIQTRFNEAQALSTKGQLTPQAQADIATNIESHAQDITNAIAKLQMSGNSQEAANIAARYQAEMVSAPPVDAQASASSNDDTLSVAIRNTLEQASSLSANVSASVNTQ